jgi:CheY-like chemotaxis protein
MQNKNSKVIVLVDDDEDDTFLIQTVFEELNIEDDIRIFRNGYDAVTYLLAPDQQAPSIVISDLNMPQMNGFELLEALLKQNYFVGGEPKFVFLTTSEKSMVPNHNFGEQIPFYTKGYSFTQVRDTILKIVSTNGLQDATD